jgi:MoxR-like ATPase
LNKAERALLLYGTLARYQRDLRSHAGRVQGQQRAEAYAAIADIAGVNASEVGEALRAGSRLERIGLVENLISEHNITDLADLMKVSEKLPPVLMREYRDQNELMAVFTRPSAKSALTPHDFSFVQDDAQMLVTLLRAAVARKEPGVNVLLYGPPGTGKTELAKVVAQAAGLELFEVEYADRDGNSLSGRDRYRSLQIAQVFLKGSAQAALLFDEVEDVFPPISTEAAQFMARAEQISAPTSGSVSGKAWVNQILEANPVPTLWVTNRIEQIDPAFRRRFAYHLELKSPPPGAREQLVKQNARRRGRVRGFTAKLTERKGLTPAQIRTAVRFAGLARTDDASVEALIERQLRNADQALGNAGHRARRAPQRDHLRPRHAQRRDPLRDSAHRGGAEGARPRHAVLLRRARHRQDRAGRAHRQGDRPPAHRQAGQRPHEQVRWRNRAEHGRHVPRSREPRKPCCCSTRPTASCRTGAARSAPTRSPRSTRCCRAWSASPASSSAPPTCSTASTRLRCGASPSRSSSCR